MLRSRFAAVLLASSLLPLAGCSGNSSSKTTTPPPAGVLILSATALTFNSATVGQTTAAQTVTLSNTGNASVDISSIALGGSDVTAFAVTNTCGALLSAGFNCTISVTFTPTAVSPYSAIVNITNDAPDAPRTLVVGLTGTGVAAPTPAVTLSTTSLSFTATQAGVATAAQTVSITNSGGADLDNLVITLTGTNPSDFAIASTTCASTLSAGANCMVSVTFTAPAANGSYYATLQFADNASPSPQTVALTGISSASVASLSLTNVAFVSTPANTTSQPTTITLTNSGGVTLNISSIALDAGDTVFAETNTCGTTLAPNASCALSVTFTPVAANPYSGAITLTDDASTSPQTITLSGTGTSATVSYHMYVLPDPGSGAGSGFMPAMQTLIGNAQKTIDMTMYELEDSTFTGWLTAACARGVTVRVIMDEGELSSSGNKSTFNTLNSSGANCSAVASNKAFENTHQKTMTVDNTTTVIMSLNLQSQYYSTTRDFAMVENDPIDIAAIEATFAQDYAAGTPSGGSAGPSDFSYTPAPGDDLIWSPTTAKADMLSIIQNAKSTLVIENEELDSSASYIINALVTACKAGVTVHLAIVDESDYESNFTTLKNAGCGVATVPDTETGFYIHAKAVVADYGLPTQSVYMGSINYSNPSMTENRELGMYVTDQPSIDILENVMSSDYTNATPWKE